MATVVTATVTMAMAMAMVRVEVRVTRVRRSKTLMMREWRRQVEGQR
jgi:hypothetical protein